MSSICAACGCLHSSYLFPGGVEGESGDLCGLSKVTSSSVEMPGTDPQGRSWPGQIGSVTLMTKCHRLFRESLGG